MQQPRELERSKSQRTQLALQHTHHTTPPTTADTISRPSSRLFSTHRRPSAAPRLPPRLARGVKHGGSHPQPAQQLKSTPEPRYFIGLNGAQGTRDRTHAAGRRGCSAAPLCARRQRRHGMRTTTTAVVLALMAGVVGLAWLVVSVTLLHAGNPTLPADGGASVGGSAFLRRHEPPAATSGDRAAFSVTLVTQSSSERLWLLRETCQRWTGPLVLVVFVPPSAADPHPDPEAHLWVPMADGSKAKIGEGVCPDAHVITHRPSGSAVGPYPVNRLRNLAVAAVRTTHFFLLDIDFWPAADLEQRLVAYATGGAGSGSDAGGDGGNTDAGPYSGLFALDRSAIVVPAFNFLGVSQGCPFADNCRQTYQRLAPRTFPQLLDCLDERGCQIFDVSRNPGGHSSTNTPHWLQMGAGPDADGGSGGPRPSPLSYRIPCFQSMKYEPYVVLKRSAALPQFDERFSGYGKNKIEFVHHLRLLNFSFTVLPGLFAVHLPHAKSQAFSHWLEADRQRVDALFDNFIAELSARHAGQYDTPMCDSGDQDESNRLTE